MGIAQLDNLVAIGKLKAEAPADAELDGMLTSGRARLVDAERGELSFESRFDLAYSAAHALALAALRFHGYRSESRYLVFQVLQQTVELSTAEWRVLDKAHAVRNRAEYEGFLDHDTKLLASVIKTAREVEKRLVTLLDTRGQR
jgi:hypothetical protein